MKLLLDANVLFPPTLRDLIFSLSFQKIVEPYWSAKIIEEWTSSVQRQLTPSQRKALAQIQQDMTSRFPNSLVQNYEYLIESIKLKDIDDRHVSAAAIHAKVDVLLTFNIKDFPKSGLRKYGITPTHPDRFLCDLIPKYGLEILKAIDSMTQLARYSTSSRDSIILALHNRGLIKSMRMLKHFATKNI